MSASVTNPESSEPMMDINTTPLIDVMLVLLIMFIITIPVQTHAVKLDLPQNDQSQPPPPIDPIKNKIVIMPDGSVLWNGSRSIWCALRQYLDITTTMRPTPELHLQPHPEARYETRRRGARRHQARATSPPWASSATRPISGPSDAGCYGATKGAALRRRPFSLRARAARVRNSNYGLGRKGEFSPGEGRDP